MESCLALLDDHVLGLSTPISLATLLDLSLTKVSASCARRAMAQFASDHADQVTALLSTSFIDDHGRLSVCIIPVDRLDTISGVVLSTNVYSVEKRIDDDVRADRDRRLTSHRVSAEIAMPMILRDSLIAHSDGPPQRIVVAESDAIVKRKIEEVKKEEPKEKEPLKKVAKEESPGMKAFMARNTNNNKTSLPFDGSSQTIVAAESDAVVKRQVEEVKKEEPKEKEPLKKVAKEESSGMKAFMARSTNNNQKLGVAIPKPKVSKPSSTTMRPSPCGRTADDESDNQNNPHDDSDSVEESNECQNMDEENSLMEDVEDIDCQNKAVTQSKSLQKTIVSRTFLDGKYLVTEDVAKMVSKDIAPEFKERSSSTSKKSTTKGKAPGAKEAKPKKQSSIRMYFSEIPKQSSV